MYLTQEYEVGSFEELHNVLSNFQNKRWYFRGHSSLDWTLIPKVGRSPFNGINDQQYLDSWKRRARAYTNISALNDWDWLALAQHHGLATRLLDWSVNPLAAAFFAVEGDPSGSACIFAYRPKWVANTDSISPFEFDGIAIFRPTAIVDRIVQQGGIFTVHGPPSLALDKSLGGAEELARIVISEVYREQLQVDLDFYYVNATALFPGLDGLSRYMNWRISKAHFADKNLSALDS
jgi:hypothetical protein